ASPVPRFDFPAGFALRAATPDDLPALESFAGDSFVDSRFWFDERFDRAAVRALYRLWVRNSVTSGADTVLALDRRGEAVGFRIGKVTGPGEGSLVLAGLAPGLRGLGLGLRLYAAAVHDFAARGVGLLRGVTQVRNVKVQRVLQSLGFRIDGAHVWYHKWF